MRNPKFRCKPLSISRAHIQARALREAKIRGISGFSASDGWFRNWRRRYEIGASIRLYGEAGDVDVGAIEPAMRDLRVQLANYHLKNIFNMDETGLFYRAMPARTYLAYNESRKTVRGTKSLKAKDRVTLVLCVNVESLTVPYIHQKNAWVDSAIYRHWWENIFLPAVRAWTDEPVALVMDNFSGHDVNCVDPTGQVSIFFFPPNSTSVHQPLDQGIISAVKINYKMLMLSKFIEAYEDIEHMQQLASQAKKGRKGLNLGCPANILDAGQIIRQSWDNLSASTILNCWRHSKCLSHLPQPSTPEPRPANYKQAHLVKRWISLEDDPEIVASDDLLLASEVDEFLNASVAESFISISPCDSHLISQGDWEIITEDIDHISDPETELRLNLFKYASEAISMPINDPILLELAKKLRDHIQNV
uniref:DDE-1 domain-containing protein n=1 Tax=Daphnia galeata TaxID=27404 RepID=A0A8J2WMR4_9CRUS|nr:unnamed protein product [Daphnia galeata]